mmetsp:Transcript_15273/g.25830  ORF Transcript_15273/g.25830 Transcript_15273/m.25830 type:complete len:309 (-) Transcript_15273:154-1080(-)
MTKKKEISAYKVAVVREESVLFDENDNDKEEEKISYASRPKNSDIVGGSTSSLGLSNSSLTSSSQFLSESGNKIKLVDKTRRAFSISIESSKAFELAIRKPRRKLKHKITTIRAQLYSIYLLLMKHHGTPPGSNDLTIIFAFFAGVVAIDLMLLFSYSVHLLMPIENFYEFGWIFVFIFFGIPYFSPLMAFYGALSGSDQVLKTVGNMNSIMITVNIPLTVALSYYKGEDPVYYLNLMVMVAMKVFLSAVSAKVRMYLINPRYSKNKEKLQKVILRQSHKKKIQQQILGNETVAQLDPDQQLHYQQLE